MVRQVKRVGVHHVTPSHGQLPTSQGRLSDLRGLSMLGFDAALGLTGLVEQMHATIAARVSPLGRTDDAHARGLTGFVYGSLRGGMHWAARGVDASLRLLNKPQASMPATPRREAAVAAINGLWGDHLQCAGNPLAIQMALRIDGQRLELSPRALAQSVPGAAGRIVVLVHGLCMNDLQWSRHGHNHGKALARDRGVTPVWLHYNSGLHVSENGRLFAARLDELVAAWPLPVTELILVGHSMGGLVARSACHHADEKGLAWRRSLTQLVCLGTPHHGAALERGGHLVEGLFELSPYVAPLARLGKARSAGITDLRFGNLQDGDWSGRDRHHQQHDDRVATPLPAGVETFLLAATLAERPEGLRHALLGDGLVSLASAWGEHRDRRLALGVPPSHKALVASANHWDLLSHRKAYACLRQWLGPRATRTIQ
jgi:pimeloyl-ACP methyl ester carboxylesterase